MLKPSLSILGCGWLGLPLGKRMKSEGYEVKGATTQETKRLLLEDSGIEPFLIKCSPNVAGERLNQFFNSKILFLTIPFKRDLKDPFFYYDQIQSVISSVESSSINFIIFTSSTAVYPSDSEVVSESDQIIPDNPRSEVLLKIEQSLMENKKFDSTIIRFAGLYGGTRQLGQYLNTVRTPDRNGLSPVNLIHLDDCIEIVYKIINNNIKGEIFNAVSDEHPTRQELYTRKALELGLVPPVFHRESHETRKIVDNKKLKRALKYQFIHPDPLK